MTFKKVALLSAAALVVIAAVALVGINLYLFRYSRYAPFLQGNRNIAFAQRVEQTLEHRSSYSPPAAGDVSDYQAARFAGVEERVEAFLGDRAAAFHDACDRLQAAAGGGGTVPVSAAVKEIGAIGPLFFEAKQAQVAAMNEADLSKEEFEWIRRELYSAAALDLPQLDLAAAAKFERLEDRVAVKQRRRSGAMPDDTLQLARPLAPKLERWHALAFFGL